jgi:hypothetical protein
MLSSIVPRPILCPQLTEGSGGSEIAWSKLHARVVVLVQLCQRGAALLDEKGREQLWFPLLECLMEPRRNPDLTQDQLNSEYHAQGK